jgi:hypothetical protein
MFATNGTSFFVQAKYDGWREAVVTDVCFWHLASILTHALNGRYWGQSGHWSAMRGITDISQRLPTNSIYEYTL